MAAPSSAAIETGVFPSGHPYVRIGRGSHSVLSIPGLSFNADIPSRRQAESQWKAWVPVAAEHDVSIWDVGRRGDFARGTTAQDIADDYSALIRGKFSAPIDVLGSSTGGAYAIWLAIRHPELVRRLVLGFTGPRLTPEGRDLQDRATALMIAGRWRSAYALAGPLMVPAHPRLAAAAFWLLGPYVVGRPKPLTVLPIDADAEAAHDATARLAEVQCPTLVVSGGRDSAYPPPLVREMVSGIPGSRHIEYPEAGHGGGGVRFAQDTCAFLTEADVPA